MRTDSKIQAIWLFREVIQCLRMALWLWMCIGLILLSPFVLIMHGVVVLGILCRKYYGESDIEK